MDKEDFELRTKTIKETFNDTRKIKCHIPTEELELDENIHQEGDFFLTEDGEFIDLEFQMDDFLEEDLVRYVEIAENLYEKYQKAVSIYIICPKDINVCVKEMEIMSDADFTIRLACVDPDPCKITLNCIKGKIRRQEMLTEEDFRALARLPVMCRKEERNYYLLQYIKIVNRLHF